MKKSSKHQRSSPEKKASAEDDRKFDDIKGNQERREYLESKINQDGELNLSQNESAFLAEQIAKGEMYDNLKDGEKALKIAKALDVQSVADRARRSTSAQLTKTQNPIWHQREAPMLQIVKIPLENKF